MNCFPDTIQLYEEYSDFEQDKALGICPDCHGWGDLGCDLNMKFEECYACDGTGKYVKEFYD